MATGGGFTLGLAFLGDEALFFCDLKEAAVFRLDLASRWVERFTGPGIRIPNYPVVDAARGRLLVSDSHHFAEPGPGVWAYDLGTGDGGALVRPAARLRQRHGARRLTVNALFVCETFARRVTRIAIRPDGSAGEATPFATTCRACRTASPSTTGLPVRRLLRAVAHPPHRAGRLRPARSISRSPTAHLFAHPTNIAFDGSALYTANLGRWHITRIDSDTSRAAALAGDAGRGMIFSGLTWDHPRGYNALAAAAAEAASAGAPVLDWSKQPLEGFESHPIADLAARFDVLVLDHPHIGEAVASDCLQPLEALFEASEIAAWSEQTIGPAMASYQLAGAALCAAPRRRDAGDGTAARSRRRATGDLDRRAAPGGDDAGRNCRSRPARTLLLLLALCRPWRGAGW